MRVTVELGLEFDKSFESQVLMDGDWKQLSTEQILHAHMSPRQWSQHLIFASYVCVPNFIPIVSSHLRKFRWGSLFLLLLLLFAKVKSTPSPRSLTITAEILQILSLCGGNGEGIFG